MTPNPHFNWLFGPHLLGVLYLLIGALQHYFPPKKINNWYGYRTQSSQSSQEAWDEAQRFSAIYMMKTGLVVLVAGIMLTIVINLTPMALKLKEILVILLFMVSGLAPAVVMIVNTEKHMTKMFGDK